MKPLRAIVTRDRTLARSAKALAVATTVLVMAKSGARVELHIPTQQDQTAKNAPGAEAATFIASVPEELSPSMRNEGRNRNAPAVGGGVGGGRVYPSAR